MRGDLTRRLRHHELDPLGRPCPAALRRTTKLDPAATITASPLTPEGPLFLADVDYQAPWLVGRLAPGG